MENQHAESTEPRRRHEFVGMMFAVAIGEVGLQTAALVQADNFIGYLPALGHLVLATAIIATSWVGWSVSRTRGGQQDVTGIFQWQFVVLLLDVSMVITYFILVRAFEFEHKNSAPRIDPSSTLAAWIGFIFVLYIFWDFVTKVIIPQRQVSDGWWQQYGPNVTNNCLLDNRVLRVVADSISGRPALSNR